MYCQPRVRRKGKKSRQEKERPSAADRSLGLIPPKETEKSSQMRFSASPIGGFILCSCLDLPPPEPSLSHSALPRGREV